jgi:hypothetical protein
MSSSVPTAIQHTYRVREDDSVLSEVTAVNCVLLPRSMLVGGFNAEGRLLMARYHSYQQSSPAWSPAFFEKEFMTDTLLGMPQQLKAVFIGSREELLIPNELYDDHAARLWMEKLQAICPDDIVYSYGLTLSEARYTFALPSGMDKLLHRYFGQTRIIPVGAYQFYKPDTMQPQLLQALIGPDSVTASLHQNGKLLWHQQFEYSVAEDIVWKFTQLCRELRIPLVDLQILCTCVNTDQYGIGPELEQYFPKIKWSAGSVMNEAGDWAPVVYLLQQLYACAL